MTPRGDAEMHYTLSRDGAALIVSLESPDGRNCLTRAKVEQLTEEINGFSEGPLPVLPLIITGNDHFFSAGADLKEIAALSGAQAFAFARMGQRLMQAIADRPAPVIAAISGYCMGGGLDLALACHQRIAAPNAIFGHRGAALGIMTGWGGTQRLSRLIGKSRALQMFLAAEKLHAKDALSVGMIDRIDPDPVRAALALLPSNVQRPTSALLS